MNKLLLLSVLFPPDPRVGGKRMYQFSKYLPAAGWKPVVVTSPPPVSSFSNASFELTNIDVRNIYAPAWWPASMNANKMNRPISQGGLKTKLRSFFKIPLGKELLLAPYIIPKLIRLCRREKVKIIYATCGPPANLFHAYLTSLITGIPLVIDLRDPWSLNFLQNLKPVWVRAIEKKLERLIIKHAAWVTFTSYTTCNDYQQLYGKFLGQKMSAVYTGFNAAVPGHRKPVINDALLIAHFGNCHAFRTMKPVLQAIQALVGEKLIAKTEVIIRCYGSLQVADIEYARENDLQSVLESYPSLNYVEGLAELLNADILLLLGYQSEKGFIPAKTFDYIMLQKPILCITECAELASIVRSGNKGYVVSQNEIAAIKSILYTCFKNKKECQDIDELKTSLPPAKYDVQSSVKELAAIFNKIS